MAQEKKLFIFIYMKEKKVRWKNIHQSLTLCVRIPGGDSVTPLKGKSTEYNIEYLFILTAI